MDDPVASQDFSHLQTEPRRWSTRRTSKTTQDAPVYKDLDFDDLEAVAQEEVFRAAGEPKTGRDSRKRKSGGEAPSTPVKAPTKRARTSGSGQGKKPTRGSKPEKKNVTPTKAKPQAEKKTSPRAQKSKAQADENSAAEAVEVAETSVRQETAENEVEEAMDTTLEQFSESALDILPAQNAEPTNGPAQAHPATPEKARPFDTIQDSGSGLSSPLSDVNEDILRDDSFNIGGEAPEVAEPEMPPSLTIHGKRNRTAPVRFGAPVSTLLAVEVNQKNVEDEDDVEEATVVDETDERENEAIEAGEEQTPSEDGEPKTSVSTSEPTQSSPAKSAAKPGLDLQKELERQVLEGTKSRSQKRKFAVSEPVTAETPAKRPRRAPGLSNAVPPEPRKRILVLKVNPSFLANLGKKPKDTSPSVTSPAESDSEFEARPKPKRAAKGTKKPALLKTPVASQRKSLPSPPDSGPASDPESPVVENLEPVALLDHAQDAPLIRLSAKMTERQSVASKPLPVGQPEVWAESRQALCETVPYFKMPQSGCHQNDRHVYSFLLDGSGHCREYLDSDIIIARAGGGMEADKTGQMVQKKHHEMTESQVQSVINDVEHHNPLIIICGNKNEGALCRMPHRYNVLGWYKPVAVWAEKTTGKNKHSWTTIKYRFERLNSGRPAWHAPEGHLLTEEERQSAGLLETRSCPTCDKAHPKIYLEGWMCLNPSCANFWKLENGQEAPAGKLTYNPAFLLSHTKWEYEEPPYNLKPPVPNVGNVVGDNLTGINTRGICCPDCGRCSSRRLFRGWKCDNPKCSYDSFPKHIPIKVPMLHNPWSSVGDGPSLTQNKHDKLQGVKVSVGHKNGFKLFAYTFEGVEGKLVHAVSNARINREPGAADDMFAAVQNQDDPAMDLHLERRRFGIERQSGNQQAPVVTETQILTPPSSQPTEHNIVPPPALLTGDSETVPVQGPLEMPQLLQDPVNFQAPASITDSITDAQMPNDDLPASAEPAIVQQPFPPTPVSTSKASIKGNSEANPDLLEPSKKQEVEDGDMMTAFSMNYGMPYKFVASGASMPFSEAPWPVRACRADLNWASQNFLDPKDHADLNEELIFAYMEGQKIEYHDDGESGLGSRIGTLSLGGKAKMHMRMKMKHYTGCSKTGIFTAERPVPGSIGGREMYEKRLAAWEELQKLKETDKLAYEKRRSQIPKELGTFELRNKKASDLVEITLNHGDIVLMEGYEIQQYLEHKVVPEQCLRFALTCRTVLPDHLQPHERPNYEVPEDDLHMSALRRIAEREEAEGLQADSQTVESELASSNAQD